MQLQHFVSTFIVVGISTSSLAGQGDKEEIATQDGLNCSNDPSGALLAVLQELKQNIYQGKYIKIFNKSLFLDCPVELHFENEINERLSLYCAAGQFLNSEQKHEFVSFIFVYKDGKMVNGDPWCMVFSSAKSNLYFWKLRIETHKIAYYLNWIAPQTSDEDLLGAIVTTNALKDDYGGQYEPKSIYHRKKIAIVVYQYTTGWKHWKYIFVEQPENGVWKIIKHGPNYLAEEICKEQAYIHLQEC